MITLESVTKIYPNPKLGRSIVALGGCDLEIKSESFVSIIGPSGSGKSTLMRLIQGLEKPSSGKINVLSQDIDLMSPEELYDFRLKNIGFINQLPTYNLFSDLTVERNLILPSLLFGKPLEESKKRAQEVLEKLDIHQLSQRKARLLSMGESMRVSLALSLVNSPPIILADEPTGQLDTKNSQIVMEMLKKVNEEDKTTIIVVSHDPSYFSYVSESFFIYNGRLGAVYTQDDFQETNQEEREREGKPKIEFFISHIDKYSYLFLPNQIRDLLSLEKKLKFVIDRSARKIFLENPDKADNFGLDEKLQDIDIPPFQKPKTDSEDQMVVQCTNLAKYYYSPSKELIFQDISFEISTGELVFLIGPSGTGKTTLLNLLSGMDLNFTGEVKILGEVVSPSNQATIEKLRSDMLYYSSQYINLYPSMSLMENINYFTQKIPRKQDFYDRDFLLHYLSLFDIRNQLVQNYSQGERKRASIILGFLVAPRLLLMDEPTANLDVINRSKVLKLLVEYPMASNASVLVVTHDLLSIIPNSRIIRIEDKKITSDGFATNEYCKKIKDNYLSKKQVKL